mgnify:CR=1 FL=1
MAQNTVQDTVQSILLRAGAFGSLHGGHPGEPAVGLSVPVESMQELWQALDLLEEAKVRATLLIAPQAVPGESDDLWQAVTTRERLARWMANYSGDLRLGGTWQVASEGEPWRTGTVTACEPGRSFTTTWHASEEEPTELVVSLEPVAGGTRLVLEHTGIQSIFYGAGWQTYLERLASDVAGEEVGGEDAWQARFTELRPAYDERFGSL